MFLIIAFILTLSLSSTDLITMALDSFDQIDSYQVTLRSSEDGSLEEIKYYYKKPGHIRMEFVKPHKGAVLVYNPATNKVRLRPFGFLKFIVLTLKPENNLIKSSRGHRVNDSDIGSLLMTVKRLQLHGTSEKLNDDALVGRQAVRINVEGKGDYEVNGIHSYNLWLDKHSLLPLKVSAYNSKGKLIEEVIMDDLQINVEFPEDFFDL